MSKKTIKKVVKISFTNPDIDVAKRTFLPPNNQKFKAMMDLLWVKVQKDKNSEFKYCSDCHMIVETRSGNEFHKSCLNVFTSNQIKGKIIISFTYSLKELPLMRRRTILFPKHRLLIM